ncbi:MAG: hypothetical protein M1833_006563 [Piccolia ochrophora]|nr:MAG: hypothetical protein M1833_006563 [Piccolia ochrophora]
MVNLGLNRLKSHTSSKSIPSANGSRSTSPARGTGEPRGIPNGLILRTTVVKARNLAAKDKGGTSDPFLVVTLGDARSVTHAVQKTLNPEWNTCFELPITGSQTLVLECVCWDKDRFGKVRRTSPFNQAFAQMRFQDYLGDFDVSLEECFTNGKLEQEPHWYPLRSTRKSAQISGEVQLQLTLTDPNNLAAGPDQILGKFQSYFAITPSGEDEEGIGRIEDGEAPEDEDDLGESSDEVEDTGKPESVEGKRRRLRLKRLKRKTKARAYEFTGTGSDVVGIVFLEIRRITDLPPERNVTRTSFDMDPFVVLSLGKKTYRTRVIRHNLNPVYDERMIFQVLRHEQYYSISFSVVDRDKLSGNDFVGTATLPLQEVASSAPEADPDTGLFSLKEPNTSPLSLQPSRSRFRLPMSRSSSAQSLTKLASRPPLKSMKSSSSLTPNGSQVDLRQPALHPPPNNLSTGGAAPTLPAPTSVPSSDSNLTASVSNPLDESSNGHEGESDPDLRLYTLPLALKNKERWESKHNPELFVRAKYVPYTALRQQFWRVMLKQYDADESGLISKVELSTMLDTLGSTLKESTINGFFRRFSTNGGDVANEELTFDQAVICLEDELERASQAKPFSGSWRSHLPSSQRAPAGGDSASKDTSPSLQGTPLNSQSTTNIPAIVSDDLGPPGEEGETLNGDDLTDEKGEEHVVEIRECPICHQPRLNKKSDADIITHIATCASQDWRQVNNLVMAGFVTPSQAQRKWYSKVITKISYGGYKLGANSANILVQDRHTGQINEERMSVYVRLGIRLLYKGLKSRDMEKKRIRKLLKSLSIKQGRKFDDPASAGEIQGFINFHKLNMEEVLLPLDKFKTFNEFFYRQLKSDARPCSAPTNPKIVVSPADCRSVVFNRMSDATSVWVKGREFSIERLLGNAYPDDAKRYVNGALGIFRLAPQDYHRFHIPVDGVMGMPKTIHGEYYTVNPMAIRSALDVYGENVRIVVPVDSVAHGRVMIICVGAMMVGSTVITAKAGEEVKRTDELGYFKFGGSTLLLLFEPGRMEFDDDLVGNSNGALETLVGLSGAGDGDLLMWLQIAVGMSIGHSPDEAAYTTDMQKEHVTQAEKEDAKRRIEGSLAPNSAVPKGSLLAG